MHVVLAHLSAARTQAAVLVVSGERHSPGWRDNARMAGAVRPRRILDDGVHNPAFRRPGRAVQSVVAVFLGLCKLSYSGRARRPSSHRVALAGHALWAIGRLTSRFVCECALGSAQTVSTCSCIIHGANDRGLAPPSHAFTSVDPDGSAASRGGQD